MASSQWASNNGEGINKVWQYDVTNEEGIDSNRESAAFVKAFGVDVIEATPTNQTGYGAAIMETAETQRQTTSEDVGVEHLESVKDFGGHHDFAQIQNSVPEQTEADFAQIHSCQSYSLPITDQDFEKAGVFTNNSQSPLFRQKTNQSAKKDFIGENVQMIKTGE